MDLLNFANIIDFLQYDYSPMLILRVGGRGRRCNSKGWIGEIYLNLLRDGEGAFLGQTLIKVEPNKVKWVVEFVQKRNLPLPASVTIRHGRVIILHLWSY